MPAVRCVTGWLAELLAQRNAGAGRAVGRVLGGNGHSVRGRLLIGVGRLTGSIDAGSVVDGRAV